MVISDVGEGVLIVAGGNQRTVHINGRNPIACIGFKVERAAISSGNGDTAAVIGRYRTAIAGANGDVISGVRGITLCELNVNLVVLADIAEGVAALGPNILVIDIDADNLIATVRIEVESLIRTIPHGIRARRRNAAAIGSGSVDGIPVIRRFGVIGKNFEMLRGIRASVTIDAGNKDSCRADLSVVGEAQSVVLAFRQTVVIAVIDLYRRLLVGAVIVDIIDNYAEVRANDVIIDLDIIVGHCSFTNRNSIIRVHREFRTDAKVRSIRVARLGIDGITRRTEAVAGGEAPAGDVIAEGRVGISDAATHVADAHRDGSCLDGELTHLADLAVAADSVDGDAGLASIDVVAVNEIVVPSLCQRLSGGSVLNGGLRRLSTAVVEDVGRSADNDGAERLDNRQSTGQNRDFVIGVVLEGHTDRLGAVPVILHGILRLSKRISGSKCPLKNRVGVGGRVLDILHIVHLHD